MEQSWERSQHAFADAAAWFAALTRHVGDRWDQPGLGEWDLRALVGHTSRSLLTVEAYLDRPAATVEVPTAADYVRSTREIAAGPAVAQRGRDAGAALGDEPAAAVAGIVRRVVGRLEDCDGSELVTTIAGGMRLRDYLPTRTFELAVHTADLATALGEPLDVPAGAATEALSVVCEIAVGDGLAGRLLLAATGRGGSGLSVL